MKRLENEHRKLVLDLQADRQPVELAEGWCYMVSSRSIRDEAGSSMLDGLQTTYPNDPGPEQQTLAVIKPTVTNA